MAKVATIKKKRNDRVKLIKKSNDLVEARYKFDIWEMRVFSKMITMIEIQDRDFQDYKIYLKEFIKDYSLENDKNSYRFLREGAEKLMRKIVTIINKSQDKPMKFQTPVVAGLRTSLFDEDGKFIQVSFHPEMKPYLLELKERFLVYDVRNILKLPSTYSIRIYELLKQYEKIRTRTLDVAEMKEILGITREYKLYANFKQRVIDKAQKDLAEFTDIRFVYEEIKDGKAVVSLVFHIEPNTAIRQPKTKKTKLQGEFDFDNPPIIAAEPSQDTPSVSGAKKRSVDTEDAEFEELATNPALFDAIFPRVKGWGISREVLQLLIDTQSEEAVRNGMAYTVREEQLGKIRDNVAGFFINAVKNRFTNKAFEVEKRQKERKELERKRLEIKKQMEELTSDYNASVNDIIRDITVHNPDVTIAAIEVVKVENKSYFGLKGVIPELLNVDDYRRDPILRGMVIQTIKRQHADRFEHLDEKFRFKSAELEAQIKNLSK
jgi:plasmid replication initiation protein